MERGYPQRDAEMVKQKFDRLSNTNKSTWDPTCPPNVRRAKTIARAILARAQAGSIGIVQSHDDEESDDNGTINLITNENGNRLPLGARIDSRSPVSSGTKRVPKTQSTIESLVSTVTTFADKFRSVADSFANNRGDDIESVVERHVNKAIASTNSKIEELKSLILSRY